jgi:hypothetical protein
MLKLCHSRVDDPRVSYVQADLLVWEPERTYDTCFFGFWLSHVPEERVSREYHMVNRFYEPLALQRRLAELGWNA